MRQNRHPYLYNRNGQFYFRYRFNKEASTALFRQEIWKSLKTSDIDKAAQKCLRLSRNAKSLERMVGEMSKGKKLTKKIAEDLVQLYFAEEYQANGFNNEWPDIDLEVALAEEPKLKSEIVKQLNQISYPINEYGDAEQYLQSYGFELPKAEPPYWKNYVQGILRARLEVYRIFLAKIKGNYNEAKVQDELFTENFSLTNAKPPSIASPPPIKTSKKISEMIPLYLAEQDSKNEEGAKWQTQEEKRVFLGYFVDFLEDKPFLQIGREDMLYVLGMIPKIPWNMKKFREYDELKIVKAINLKSEYRTIKPKTAKKRWDCVKAFVEWLIGVHQLNSNVLASVTFTVKKPTKQARDAFTKDELKKWFEFSIYTGCKSKRFRREPGNLIVHDARYWIPLIALYSGMRMAEIVQMEIDDVRKEQTVWVFDVNLEVKNGIKKDIKNTVPRLIPIHKELIRLDFLNFWKSRKKQKNIRIFDEIKLSAGGDPIKGNYSKNYSRQFAEDIEAAGVKVGDRKEKIVFHSLRHNFINALQWSGVNSAARKFLSGHNQADMDKFYLHANFDKLKEYVDLVDHKIDLDHLIEMK